MNKETKIYLAGHNGLVGSAIYQVLKKKGFNNIVVTPHSEFDLTRQSVVEDFFKKEKPEYVFLAAAKVGGILANNTYRAQFIYENLMIQNNIIHQSYVNNVKKLLFLGSSCIYPKNNNQPIDEDSLLTDELEFTNEPYAIAKIAGIKMCESYNLQYGTDFIAVMPTNLYGPNDNYDLEKSHVLPALIRKMHLGKFLMDNNWNAIDKDFKERPIHGVSDKNSINEKLDVLAKYGITKSDKVTVTLWGTGKPRREFMYSEDMADACVYLMENCTFSQLIKDKKEIRNSHINIGTGTDLTIYELSEIIKSVIEYKGEIVWDKTKPDGTFQKLLNVNKLKGLGWSSKTPLHEGIKKVYEKYTF